MALMDPGRENKPRNEGANMPAGATQAHNIRRQVDDWKDSYLRPEEQPSRPSVCENCGAVYANHRWYEADDSPVSASERGQLPKVICPADRRKRDRVPGGVVTLSGGFFNSRREDIEDLIHNEEQRARKTNPMERIIDVEDGNGTLVLHVTNPKLAQRIGHALEKAYHGVTDYKWSEDTRLARVDWSRD